MSVSPSVTRPIFPRRADILDVDPSVTGGTYRINRLRNLHGPKRHDSTRQGGTTDPIPYNATAAFVQNQLENLVGFGNVAVIRSIATGRPGLYTITFQGESTGLAIAMQVVSVKPDGDQSRRDASCELTQGGVPSTDPPRSPRRPNTIAPLDGNNAQVGVIIDGSKTEWPPDIGFVINASNSSLRGLAIEGFGVGVSVPNPTDVGDLIQGNFIGNYLSYPVDPMTGSPLPAPNNVELVRLGNTQQGVVLGSRNATVGGTDPQAANVIAGNGAQGVLIEPGASGNQVLGNQIGVVGPSISGFYFQAGNGARRGPDRVVRHRRSNPSSIVYSSSNIIGGAAGGSRAISSRRTAVTASISRAWGRRETWSRPTTSAWRPAAAFSSAAAIPATLPTACGSTTGSTTRSAADRRATAT